MVCDFGSSSFQFVVLSLFFATFEHCVCSAAPDIPLTLSNLGDITLYGEGARGSCISML